MDEDLVEAVVPRICNPSVPNCLCLEGLGAETLENGGALQCAIGQKNEIAPPREPAGRHFYGFSLGPDSRDVQGAGLAVLPRSTSYRRDILVRSTTSRVLGFRWGRFRPPTVA